MNRVVAITGGTKGLGRALAQAFAREGDVIAICARNESGLEEMSQLLTELDVDFLTIKADVSKEVDVEKFVSSIEANWGRIDLLINNASTYGNKPTLLADYPTNTFEEVMQVNVMNPLYLTQRVLPGMLTRNEGMILNVTSEAGHTGYAGWGAYGVSKFALEGLTEIWYDELKDFNVSIKMVDPGEMDTEMHDLAVPNCDYELSDPNDVAKAFVYLASEAGSQMEAVRVKADDLLKEVSQHDIKNI
ncbi:SDR family NAD(P)-dependent oxidoreductase [Filobacillus milosensis]|nr:SDR family oxidoreductase [Filobacillus milosensis]